MRGKLYFISILIILSSIGFSEVQGTLNQTNVNPITGLYGYVLEQNNRYPCTENSDCYSGYCREDYDGGKYCASSSTSCVHKLSGDTLATIYYDDDYAPDCKDSTTRWVCSNGVWVASECPSGKVCDDGECVSSSNNTDSSTQTNYCTAGWYCYNSTHKGYKNLTCSWTQKVFCKYGCSDGECKSAPSSESGEASLSFVYFPSNWTVEEGQNKTFVIRVNNTGDISLSKVVLNITSGLPKSNFNITPLSAKLDPNKTAAFVVYLYTKGLTFGKRTITLKASNNTISVTKSLTLYINPNNSTRNLINETILNMTKKLEELEKLIEQKKSEGINVTYAEQNLNNLKNKLNTAEEQYNSGSYIDAFNTLKDMESTIEGTMKMLETMNTAPKKRNYVVIIAIVFLVSISVAIVYFMWPKQSGYKVGVGYVPRERNKISEFFNNLVEKYKRWRLMRKLQKEEEKFKKKFRYRYKP